MHHNNPSKPISKIAHRIWFGESFSETYQRYLIRLATLHSDYVTKLWTDPESMSTQSHGELQAFCSKNNITLCDIRQEEKLENHAIILNELERAKQHPERRRLHYVRASDVARIAILYNEGGIYSDTDSCPIEQFPVLDSKHGILLKLFFSDLDNICLNYYTVVLEKFKYYFGNIHYDFIAAAPVHPLLKTCCEIIQQDFSLYSKSKNLAWEHSTNARDLTFGTIKLTGSALRHALNHSYQTGILKFDDPSELFFDSQKMMPTTYDKSWLEGYTVNDKEVENEALNRFINELEKNRRHHFPAKVMDQHPLLREDTTSSVKDRLFNYGLFTKQDITAFTNTELNHFFQRKLNLDFVQPEPLKVEPIQIKTFAFSAPVFKFTTSITLSYPSVSKIEALYRENGGSRLSAYSIFSWKKNVTSFEVIELLRKRAKKNEDVNSASHKTLAALNL